MRDIKIKDIGNKTIKSLDKTVTGLRNTKDNLVDVKNNVDNIFIKEESVNQGAGDKIITGSNYIKAATITTIPKVGNRGLENTKKNIIKLKNKGTKKLTEKTVKNTIKTGNKAIKGSVKTTKATINNTKRTAFAIKQLTHKSYLAIKASIIATGKAIKLAVIGTKALVSALIAGGWIALVIIILVCIIGLFCSSVFGIFFAGESSNSSMRVSDVVKSIDTELVNKTELIKTQNPHDEVILKVDRAPWSEVLALYSAKTTGGTGMNEVITMNASKAQTLKDIFFQMHTITHEVKIENLALGGSGDYEIGGTGGESKKVLYITITSKSVEEMMNAQYFTLSQKNEVNELLKDEYATLWSSTIYGTSIGSSDIVTVALSQLGNVGGQPYWSWYGFETRVEWCATFVSWVANEVGYIKCSDCNNSFSIKKKGKYEYYYCNTFLKQKRCTNHAISKEKLIKTILPIIQIHIDVLIDFEKILKNKENIKVNDYNEKIIESQIKKINDVVKEKRMLLTSTEEDYNNKYISKEDYESYYKSYSVVIEKNLKKKEKLEEELKNKINSNNKDWIEKVKKNQNIEELTRNLIEEFVENIYINDNKNIEVIFKYQNEYLQALDFKTS